MRLRTILTACIAALSAVTAAAQTEAAATAPQRTRQSDLFAAKNLVLTDNKGTTYYYLVTNDVFPTIRLEGAQITIRDDVFQKSAIKTIRFRSLGRHIMSEDSTTFDKTRVIEHGLIALRRSLQLDKWNSLVVPFDMTAAQLLDAFGEDAQLATPRGVSQEEGTVLEFSTVDLSNPDKVVVTANYHYLLRPTREPDVAEGKTVSTFVSGTRLPGPIYYIADVSTKKNAAPRTQTLKSDDGTVQLRYRGSYTLLDNSVLNAAGRPTNRKIAPGTYQLSDDGIMLHNEDSAVVRAFTSWIEDISETPAQLSFYIDGIGDDLTAIADLPFSPAAQQAAPANDPAVYDLGGRRVAADAAEFSRNRSSMRPGVYVVNGRKYIIK